MGVTQRELADRLDVSQMSVSLALSGRRGRISEKTRSRILEKSRELGYLPHGAARAMRRGSFDSIAYLSCHGSYSFVGKGPIMGAMRVLQPLGMHLLLTELGEDELSLGNEEVPRILRELSADGILVNYIAPVSDKMLKAVEGAGIPALWLNNKLDFNCVYPDWEGGAGWIVRDLAGRGHRRIAFGTMMDSPEFAVGERFKGYLRAMAELGLPPLYSPSNTRFNEWRSEIICSPEPPTAVLAYGSEARRAYAAAIRAGLRVPEDISIVAFDTMGDLCTDDMKVFSSMFFSMTELGARATGMLREMISEPGKSFPPLAMPMEFHQGDTSAGKK